MRLKLTFTNQLCLQHNETREKRCNSSVRKQLTVSSNAVVFNKTLPYSPGHKANINYEGARRGQDTAKRTILTGTHNAQAPAAPPCTFSIFPFYLFLALPYTYSLRCPFCLVPSPFRVLASWGTVTREWRVLPATTRVAC